MTRVAILQMTTGIDPAANAAVIVAAVKDAAAGGAEMLFTPEMSGLLDRDRDRAAGNIAAEEQDGLLAMVRDAAAGAGLWVALGSLAVRRDDGRLANRAFTIDPAGNIAARYDKMHMFDVTLSTGETWRKSAAYAPGENVVVVDDTPVGRLGLTICYDVRFPALYEQLGRRQCDAIAIPAAFTVPTGQAHWHLMQRARAVEASAWVISAAQVGEHADGRKTYGHSLVVDPWGEVVLDMGGEKAGLGFAEIDQQRTADVRSQLQPCQQAPRAHIHRMIVFDLACGLGHRFEGWFGSSADYAGQRDRGQVACPQCGSAEVDKAPMAPAVPRKGNSQPDSKPVAGGALPPEAAAMLRTIARMQTEALKTSTWVGDAFAEQSRKMHYGEADAAPIHGKATADEARGLAEEGISVLPLFVPVTPPEELN